MDFHSTTISALDVETLNPNVNANTMTEIPIAIPTLQKLISR
jgi:hemin uptake protein HemP